MKRILPEGYYIRNENNPYIVTLCFGPYKGLKIQICENIKIRESDLTSSPNLCYNYRCLDYSKYEPLEVESSKVLSRIIAAIVVEFLSEEILEGGTIEGVKCRKPGSKISS
jgi:hypothetical protein